MFADWDVTRQFFWIIEHEIAGSSLPFDKSDIDLIQDKGIKIIISLTGSEKISNLLIDSPLKHHPMDIKDFWTPGTDIINEFIKIMSNAKKNKFPVLIHCYAGCGKTGLMLVLYLMIFYDYSYQEGLNKVRTIRKCAVESDMQLKFLKNFENIGLNREL